MSSAILSDHRERCLLVLLFSRAALDLSTNEVKSGAHMRVSLGCRESSGAQICQLRFGARALLDGVHRSL